MAGDSNRAGRVLRLPQVEELVGLKKTSIHNRMNPSSKYYDATFPERVEIGGRAVGWIQEEILRWVAARPKRGSSRPAPRKSSIVGPKASRRVDVPLESPVPVAQGEAPLRSYAEEVLREAARSRKVLSYSQFIESVRERANSAVPLADEVLDRIDTSVYEAKKLLPTVVIQERGSPLIRTKRLAQTLGLKLSSEQVKAQRQALFLAHLEPSDPRPLGFRWYSVKGASVMSPIYERTQPARGVLSTPDEEKQAAAMRARYDAIIERGD